MFDAIILDQLGKIDAVGKGFGYCIDIGPIAINGDLRPVENPTP